MKEMESRIPMPRPYQSEADVEPMEIHQSISLSRSTKADRSLTHAQRWMLREQNRIGKREGGSQIFIEPNQRISRSIINGKRGRVSVIK